MRVKQKIMPYIAKGIGSKFIHAIHLKYAEIESRLRGSWPVIEVFLQADDPYSQLLLEYLLHFVTEGNLTENNGKVKNKEVASKLKITIRWIVDKEQNMFPEPEMLHKYAQQDAEYLADKFALTPPKALTLSTSHKGALSYHLEASTTRPYTNSKNMMALLDDLRHFSENPEFIPSLGDKLGYAKRSCDYNAMTLKNRGHYNSAMLFFAGEWYWGLDRISYLQNRLQKLGLFKTAVLPTAVEADTRAC